MIAICAIENQTFQNLASALMEDAGYVVYSVSDREKLLSLLDEFMVELILSDRTIEGESITDLPVKYPETVWIVHLTDIFGLAGSDAICSELHFSDYIPEPAAISNIYAAIWMAKQRHLGSFLFDSNYIHAQFQSRRASVQRITDRFNANLMTSNDPDMRYLKQDGIQCLSHIRERFFRNSDEGTLDHCHFGAIFYRLVTENKTGRLHLRRPGLHWVIFFKEGAPFDIDMRISAVSLDFPAWLQRNSQLRHTDFSTDLNLQDNEQTRRDRIKRVPDNSTLFRKWLCEMIYEIFSWPQGEFLWLDGNIPPTELYHPHLNRLDCLQILKTGVFFWQSESSILEMTQSVLPYFLKLKDNETLSDESFLTEEIDPVVEKLKLGDNLTEILAGCNDSHLVHAVIYLLIMMGHLELIS